jgi:hypothetical protein
MKTYTLTDRSGPYVAGIRVAGLTPSSDGKLRIELSDDQALFDLNTGAIELEVKAKPPVVKAAESDVKA